MREPIGSAEIDCSLLARVECATVNNISNRASELRSRQANRSRKNRADRRECRRGKAGFDRERRESRVMF